MPPFREIITAFWHDLVYPSPDPACCAGEGKKAAKVEEEKKAAPTKRKQYDFSGESVVFETGERRQASPSPTGRFGRSLHALCRPVHSSRPQCQDRGTGAPTGCTAR